MIQVYGINNIDYSKNGDMAIQPTRAELTNALNTIPSIEIELDYDKYGRYKSITDGCAIKCDTPWRSGQLFRVYETEKDMDTYKIYARHIFADLIDTLIKDLNASDVLTVATGQTTGQLALNKLLANTNFTGTSNITKLANTTWTRETITLALLGDADNSFVNLWGGELWLDNFNVTMNSSIGVDKNVRIAYGKNLKGITETKDRSNVVTRIIPVGVDNIRLTGKTPWVDSQYINKYPKVHETVVEFNDVKVKSRVDDVEGFKTLALAQAELKRVAGLMFTEQHVDVPSINIKIEMEDISQSLEYKSLGYSALEVVNLGDTVTCVHSKLDIETKARCIGYTWDILTQKMIEVEIGDTQKNYFDKQSDITNKVSKAINADGTINGMNISGVIDATKTKFRALRDVAQIENVRAMLFEDLNPSSPTYGAMCLGSMGFEIAGERNSSGDDWNWRTFATGKGFTADAIVGGSIDAGIITSGILKAITIQNNDGSFSINLGSNAGAVLKNGGQLAMKLEGNEIKFYSWNKNGDYIGSIGSTVGVNSNNAQAITLWNDLDSYIRLGYKNSSGNVEAYIDLDAYTMNNTEHSISIYKNTYIPQAVRLYFGKDVYATGNSDGSVYFNGDIYATGGIRCGGQKTRAVDTESYGRVYLNAYETPNALFADYGHDELNEKGECSVNIDPIFLQTISINVGYEVFLTKHGKGDIWVEKTNNTNFKICGEPNLKFSWNIVAKQKGFENTRLEKVKE